MTNGATKRTTKGYEAYCLHCNGGGKSLAIGTKRDAERTATSHQSAYGCNVTILDKRA